MRVSLDTTSLHYSKSTFIEVYLYTKYNIIIPMETSGKYGIKYMAFNPMENATYFERFYVYKNSIKRLKSTTLGCKNYDKADSTGHCIVNFVEDTYNCTSYQIYSNKFRQPCNTTYWYYSKHYHMKLKTLSEYGIYNVTKCLPHCEHDEIEVRRMGKPRISSNKGSTFTLEFQFDNEVYKSREEYILYDGNSFIADVGGYLGLLLGHSMLSIYSRFVEWLSKFNIWKKISKQ